MQFNAGVWIEKDAQGEEKKRSIILFRTYGMILVLRHSLNNQLMDFKPLESEEQLSEIKKAKGYNVIFKHNTTCPISKSVRSKFEEEAETLPEVNSVYFLDLLSYRDLSDSIAEEFNVKHESPQLLLIKDGKCTYSQSLYDISAEETAEAIERN